MASPSEKPDICCYVMLLGEAGVGKTCIINRQCRGTFPSNQGFTLSPAYEQTKIMSDGKSLQITFVDTAGQERFDALLPMLYRKADIFALVYDITKRSTFEKLTTWLVNIHQHKDDTKTESIKNMLIGNKADLDGREVSYDDGKKFAEEKQLHFFETSAKTGQNIDEVFEHLTNELIEHAQFFRSADTLEEFNGRRTKRCCSGSSSSVQSCTPVSASYSRTITPQRLDTSLTRSRSSTVASHSTEIALDQSVLSSKDLYLVRREIDALPNWIDLGLELGLYIDTLRKIKSDEKTLSDCTREMLAAWLEQQDQVEVRGGPSWQQLASALRVRKCKSLAKSIERNHLPRP